MRNGISQTALLVLCLALAACKPPAPEPGIAPSPAAAPAAASPTTSAATPAAAESDPADDDLTSRRPDDSYRKANLRPEYDRCIEAAGAVTPDLYACNDEELAFHERKLEEQFSRLLALPDGQEKDRLMDEQAAYMHDTRRHCAFNPEQDGQGQMLDAQSCRINRTANRVPALSALADMAEGKAQQAKSDEQDWAPVPTTQKRAPVTGDVDPEAPILDEDGNPYTPDSSYDRANLRPQFGRCIDASNAETPALQACGDEEYLFQRKRMMAALDSIDAAPDSVSKDRLMDEQDTYMRDTDLYCRFDPRTQGQGHMLNAQSCRINRLANRADALERVIRRAGKADAKKN